MAENLPFGPFSAATFFFGTFRYFYDRLGSMRTRVTNRQADAAGYIGPAEGYGEGVKKLQSEDWCELY